MYGRTRDRSIHVPVPMSVGIIVNFSAGAHRRLNPESRIQLAEAALRDCCVEGRIVFTRGVGSAGAGGLAREMIKKGATSLVAWGGDGTVNEVASETARSGLVLGIVPGGSGNRLARELGIEKRPADALRTALQGAERTIDAGEVAGRLFFNVAGLGFDAHLARIFNTFVRRGPQNYIRAGLRELLAYDPVHYTVRADNETLRQRAFVIAIANGRQYGNGAVIAPRAKLDDGQLDVVLLPVRPPWIALWHARRLFTGTLERLPGVRMISVRTAVLSADRPLTFHVDGEVFDGGQSLQIQVRPGALRVRVPSRGLGTGD